MIDIGREYRTAFCYFLTDKFGSDMSLDSELFTVHIFPDSHIFHFRSDNASFGICHLGDGFSFSGTVGKGDVLKTKMVQTLVVPSHLPVFRSDFGELFHIAT